MKRFIPVPGDLIIVEFSEWYALKDGERLRVCENCDWIEIGEELYVAPRLHVNTFWGPDYGQPDGRKPEVMSTSGGPFTTIKIKDLVGLELIGTEEDRFWHWQGELLLLWLSTLRWRSGVRLCGRNVLLCNLLPKKQRLVETLGKRELAQNERFKFSDARHLDLI